MRSMNPEYFALIEKCIDRCREENGCPPTVYDIERATGIPKSTVSRYLSHMREQGMIEFSGRRSLITADERRSLGQTCRVPVLGAIACGIPKLAEENIEEYVRLPQSLFGSGELYLLRADGDSMINAGISRGDLVLIRSQSHADPGQIIVALVGDDTATLKRYRPFPADMRVDLVPENDDFETQHVDLRTQSFAIQGVAIKVIKDLE